MTLVALQPATPNTKEAVTHYLKTVVHPINLSAYSSHIPAEQMAILQKLYPAGEARLWGVSPGESQRKFNRWNQLSPGAKVLFYTGGQNKSFTALATITYTVENGDLAGALWSLDKGEPFKYLYFIDDIRAINVPYQELIPFIRTKPDWRNTSQRAFDVLTEQQSAGLLDYLGVEDAERTPAIDQAGYTAAVHAGIAATDRAYTAVFRQEQKYLRASLIPGDTGTCDMCGREFAREFLRAAHIKKRSACTEAERLDVDSIAMIACVFGCDALYESGDLGVNANGHIVISPTTRAGGPEEDYVRMLIKGRRCEKWVSRKGSRLYFDWHWRTTYKNKLSIVGADT